MKTVFADIDGTFFSGISVSVPQINIDAVNAIQAQGDRFVFVSGRGLSQITPLLEDNNIDCDIIFGNGAGYKIVGEEPNYQNCIHRKDLAAIINILENNKVFYHIHTSADVVMRPFELYAEQFERMRVAFVPMGEFGENAVAFKQDYFTNHALHVANPLAYLLEHPELEVLKFELMEGDSLITNQVAAELTEIGLYCYSSFLTNLEIVNPKSNKGVAIEHYLKLFPSVKTYGIGDAENDVAMLSVVDVPVAMRNATEEIKAMCQYVAGDCEDGGLGLFIFEHVIE